MNQTYLRGRGFRDSESTSFGGSRIQCILVQTAFFTFLLCGESHSQRTRGTRDDAAAENEQGLLRRARCLDEKSSSDRPYVSACTNNSGDAPQRFTIDEGHQAV